MAPNKRTVFNESWLHESNYMSWLQKDNERDTIAKCKICLCAIDLSNMGRRALDSHSVTNSYYMDWFPHNLSVIIRLSGPIKHEYAATHKLDEKQLLSDSTYKENYRKDMVTWSERIRDSDPAHFICAAIKMYKAELFPIWIVSDVRRRSDLRYFFSTFPDKIVSIRVSASEETRKARGFVFTPGIDDAETECDLDGYTEWSLTFSNDGGPRSEADLEEFLDKLTNMGLRKLP